MLFLGLLLMALFIFLGLPGYKDIIHSIKGEPTELPNEPIYVGMKIFFVIMPIFFVIAIVVALCK